MEIETFIEKCFSTEFNSVCTSIVLATLTFVFLKKMTSDTKSMKMKKHQEKIEKQALAHRARIAAIEKEYESRFEMQYETLLEQRAPSRSNNSYPDMDLRSAHSVRFNSDNLWMAGRFEAQATRQRFSHQSAARTRSAPASFGSRRSSFDQRILSSRGRQGLNGRSSSPLAPGESYRDWSLRRLNVQVRLMDL